MQKNPFLLAGAHQWRSKSNASWSRMTQREKDDEQHRARGHMQFVWRMFKLQHDEGRHFLHEHRQSELPWRKDSVEEIEEMTGAKLMFVSQGSLQSAVNEKPTATVLFLTLNGQDFAPARWRRKSMISTYSYRSSNKTRLGSKIASRRLL